MGSLLIINEWDFNLLSDGYRSLGTQSPPASTLFICGFDQILEHAPFCFYLTCFLL